jgi:hypothetical protein
MKFGRRRPVAPHPHLKLGNYLKASFPAAPVSADYSAAGGSALTDIFCNDVYGCCVISGGYHVTAAETGNAGDLFHASSAEIIADYSAIGNFNPANPTATDNGCLLTDALAYWSTHGFANGTKLLGYLAVDPTNQAEVMAACYLFENLYHAFELPDAWVSPMPSGDGFVWDVAPPNPQNGHCVMSVGYDSNGVKIDSWGLFGTVTWKALAALGAASAGGELWVMLTPDQMTKGQTKAPNGILWGDLLADFNSIGGHVPVIAPSPPVTPAPYGTVVTADMATAWLKAAFDAAHPILDRTQAEAIVASTLAARWPVAP